LQKDEIDDFREDWLNLWFSQTISDFSQLLHLQRWFVQLNPQLSRILKSKIEQIKNKKQ
jgi:hypothetical protein